MSFSRGTPLRGAGRLFAALLALGALAGCGSSSSSGTSSTSSTQATAASGGSTATATSSSSGPSKTSTSQASTGSTKAASNGSALPQVGGHVLRHFTGSGNAHLGTIVVRSPEVLAWSAQHPPIQIFTTHGFLLVSSHSSSGTVQLARGVYSGLRVASHGGWSIALHARS
ncbi:MAG TPA: hypothetical protein VK781_14160 [Solirubrobacteraceae bacterium]|jgi:hypothetical protein|nr:hypothetical protein [Solirubrobacteraceae bacterium]